MHPVPTSPDPLSTRGHRFQPVPPTHLATSSPERAPAAPSRLRICLGTPNDRDDIYRIRHAVYATELGQHQQNAEGRLSDPLDAHNIYFVAKRGDEVVGFVSVTPPEAGRYSLDKYLPRDEWPFEVDARSHEVRLLTVVPEERKSLAVAGLMLAALRWVEARGGTRLFAIGRVEVLDLYRRAGLVPLGTRVRSGAVEFELLAAEPGQLRSRGQPTAAPATSGAPMAAGTWPNISHHLSHALVEAFNDGASRRERTLLEAAVDRLERQLTWELDVPLRPPTPTGGHSEQPSTRFWTDDGMRYEACPHGGRSFDRIGDDFEKLERRFDTIDADVLDAWFDPSPAVLEALRDHLPWLIRRSPPADSAGLIRTLAEVRQLPARCIWPCAGSSQAIHTALRRWLTPRSRVLLLDPTYGEYAHVMRQIVGCRVDSFELKPSDKYRVDLRRYQEQLEAGYDLAILVNPNSPTGQHVRRRQLAALVQQAPRQTRFWVDETYVDYVGPGESLEAEAVRDPRLVVCKSMSKVYALSGMRVAYLVGDPSVLDTLRRSTPPWALGLPAQVAAIAALRSPDYYAERYAETHRLREDFARQLESIKHVEVVSGVANFVLVRLGGVVPPAAVVSARCEAWGLYVRDARLMGASLGDRSLRIAVKDASTNARSVAILRQALASC